MIGFIGLWSHALAAVLFGALAAWELRHWQTEPRTRSLTVAFFVTAVWAIFTALRGPDALVADMAESGRNVAFLTFMYAVVQGASEGERLRALRPVYAMVAAVIGLQIVVAGVTPQFANAPAAAAALASTAHVIGLTIAAGSLVLVHNLYGQAAPESRWGIRLPAIALAVMWGYDLHLYTVAYLTDAPTGDLAAMRGAVLAMTAPLFMLASRRNEGWRMRISRAATFQSLSAIAILAYLIVMMSATRALAAVGGEWARIGQIGLVSAMTIAILLFLPSGKARAWLRVILAKHLFEHRYDYREEWLAFTRTLGTAGEDAAPLSQRIVKALADIAGSPAGVLLIADEERRLSQGAEWNWRGDLGRASAEDVAFVRLIEATGHVVDFAEASGGNVAADGRTAPLPTRSRDLAGAWAGIPLLHDDRLVGLVILAPPHVRRPLDWEDFDLFRAAGIQAASYLAEARGQEALADARRFEEFNRRFAFIMHDIKNLVSQLSLVARNAERHAENPAFRADMIATLQGSVRKMNDLLARLSHGGNGDGAPPRPLPLAPLVEALAAVKRRVHPVTVDAERDVLALADPARLEQALGHLVQNAIEASAPDAPVTIRLRLRDSEAAIEVIDRGAGMSADFLRARLFTPFASTKESGFGVGAFEARALVAAMGGRIEVESREGEGSRFTIFLPAAPAVAAHRETERMPA